MCADMGTGVSAGLGAGWWAGMGADRGIGWRAGVGAGRRVGVRADVVTVAGAGVGAGVGSSVGAGVVHDLLRLLRHQVQGHLPVHPAAIGHVALEGFHPQTAPS